MKSILGVIVIMLGLIMMLAGMGNAITEIIPVKASLEWIVNLTGIIIGLVVLIAGASLVAIGSEFDIIPTDISDYMARDALKKKK